MTAERRLPAGLTPRLLGRDAAAAYLGISANHFDRHVVPDVPPILIGERNLWDIRILDRWLDGQSGLVHAPKPKQKWLGALDGDSHEGR